MSFFTANTVWGRTDYNEETGCWDYRGLADSVLAPIMPSFDWKALLWEACKGPVPEGMTVYSKCGNEFCANPHHFGLKEDN